MQVDDNSGLTPPDGDEEGVRIIGPDEVAEVVERGGVAQRRPENEPKFGDRPAQAEAQPKGPRPTLRFPLPDSEGPADIERPKVKPPRAPEEDDRPRSLFSVTASSPGHDPDDDILDDEPFGDRDEPLDAYADADDPAPEDRRAGDPGGVMIPHWTEPATGELPAVLGGDAADDDAWQAFSEGAPRWRDDSKDFDDRDDMAALADDAARVGALDPDAPGEHELLSFDDLGVAGPARAKKAPAKKKKKKAAPASIGAVGSSTSDERRRAVAGDPQPVRGAAARSRQGAPGAQSAAGRAGGSSGGGGGRDLPTAVGVGAVLAIAALVLLALGPGWAMLLVAAVALLGAAEFFTTTRRAGYQPAQLLGIAACVAMPMAAYWKGTLGYPVVLGLVMMCGFLWYIIGAGDERPTMNLGVTMLGIGWVGVLGSFAGLLLGAPDGASLFLSVVLVAVAHDVGAFFVGGAIGRAPLTPISPNKTIEGLAGGIVAAIVAALVLVGAVGIGPFSDSILDAFLLGLVVGTATAIGDLCESVVKRDLGVKDMGNILPGHGGVLDRMDGILFALPAAFYLGLVLF
jgi:phosphatidate cytidylyltransferase